MRGSPKGEQKFPLLTENALMERCIITTLLLTHYCILIQPQHTTLNPRFLLTVFIFRIKSGHLQNPARVTDSHKQTYLTTTCSLKSKTKSIQQPELHYKKKAIFSLFSQNSCICQKKAVPLHPQSVLRLFGVPKGTKPTAVPHGESEALEDFNDAVIPRPKVAHAYLCTLFAYVVLKRTPSTDKNNKIHT